MPRANAIDVPGLARQRARHLRAVKLAYLVLSHGPDRLGLEDPLAGGRMPPAKPHIPRRRPFPDMAERVQHPELMLWTALHLAGAVSSRGDGGESMGQVVTI